MDRTFSRTIVAAATLSVAFGIAGTAKAGVLASVVRTNDFVSSSTAPVPLPLNDGGSTSLAFSTSAANQKVVITYNAECVAIGPGPGSWLSVSISVDGNPTNPNSGSNFALCTSTGAGGTVTSGGVWTGAVRQSIYVVPAKGVHHVTITGQGVSGTTSWRVDDTSLVVER